MIGAIVGEYFGGSFNALGVLIRSDAQIFELPTRVGRDRWSPRCSGSSLYARGRARRAAPRPLGARGSRTVAIRNPTRPERSESPQRSPPGEGRRREQRMKKRWIVGALVLAIAAALAATGRARPRRAPAAPKLTNVTLQLKWVPQAQFAGYYAASQEGLLHQGGPERHAQERRPGHHPGAGRRQRPGAVRRRLAAEPARSPRQGHRPRQRRAGLRPLGHDAAHVEELGDHVDRRR